MKNIRICLLVFILGLLFSANIAQAQTYFFSLDSLDVHVFWNEDGTSTIQYTFDFTNQPAVSPIDYVDLGLPNTNFDANNISADVDSIPITDISKSGYQGSGTGVALGLGSNAIQPGSSGTVHAIVRNIRNVLYPDDEDEGYASAVFDTPYFGEQYMTGNTAITVTFHLPPNVQPEEPRWHNYSPSGFPSEPETGFDEQGRITYTWRNPQAEGYSQHKFGASFPTDYIPEETIVQPTGSGSLGSIIAALTPNLFCCGFFVFVAFIILTSIRKAQTRKLQYLPPKIAIEGHGIKRGLTAIEAAILLEQPMDKILTMILFSTIKKGAASVKTSDPLELDVTRPLPDNLHAYEISYLEAFDKKTAGRRKALQDTMIDLVKSVSKKMKGFSRRETVDYYKNIVERAWAQVEAANTPEVKSEKFDEVMEWTMLDEDYDDRTREVFRTGPVFVPVWWPRYDPGFGRSAPSRPSAAPVSIPRPTGTGTILPNLPGSAFAASIANGVQNFSSNVVGNIRSFTSGITQKTNPPPVATRSSGSSRSGGCACACACACAGCACACAGGGR